MHDLLRPHLSQEQLDEYAEFTDERARLNLALGIKGVVSYTYMIFIATLAD